MLRPDGELAGVLDLLSRDVRPPDPALMAVLADIGRQIGQFVQRERAEAENARVVAAVEQSADGVLISDTTGTIVYANPALERLSGYARSELLGQNPRLFWSGRHDAHFYAEMWAALSAGRSWSSTMVNRRKDGSFWEADSVITPVRDAAGTLVGYLQLTRDVTRERELEAQLRQTQKMETVGRLAGGIAHDFNNLLTAISGYSQLLLADLAADDPHRADVAQIDRAAGRATELTHQLLAFSRRQVLQPVVVDLNTIVRGIAPMLRRLLGEDVALRTTLASDLGAVRADPGQIEQVIVNLAVNARDAMPSGGTLTLETANIELDDRFVEAHSEVTPGHYVRLVARDTGSGMDAETLARIFEPFFTTKDLGKGTGLGLATVYGIVKQSGGYIYVTSEPDAGAAFSVYLPQVDEPVSPGRGMPAAGDAALGDAETVLVVEDETAVRDVVRTVLERHGYRVLAAGDASEALAIATAHPASIDLLLTDVVLPGLSGPELAEQLRDTRSGLRVLFTSGYAETTSLDLAALGPHAYLAKPFTLDGLARKVREALDAPVEPWLGNPEGHAGV